MKLKHGDKVMIKDLLLGGYGYLDGEATYIKHHKDGKSLVIETDGGMMNVSMDRLISFQCVICFNSVCTCKPRL